jgi:hypothetical protein
MSLWQHHIRLSLLKEVGRWSMYFPMSDEKSETGFRTRRGGVAIGKWSSFFNLTTGSLLYADLICFFAACCKPGSAKKWHF